MTSPSHGEDLVFESRRAHIFPERSGKEEIPVLGRTHCTICFSETSHEENEFTQNTPNPLIFQWKQRGINMDLCFHNRLHLHCTCHRLDSHEVSFYNGIPGNRCPDGLHPINRHPDGIHKKIRSRIRDYYGEPDRTGLYRYSAWLLTNKKVIAYAFFILAFATNPSLPM